MCDQEIEDQLKLNVVQLLGAPEGKIITDEDGNALTMGVLDGKLVPPIAQENYRKIVHIPIGDDDVVLVGYPRTGSHWTWEILSMIVAGKAEHSALGRDVCVMEIASEDMPKETSSRRILSTHVWLDYFPNQVLEKKTKIVFIVRNPKDTAVSLYNMHRSLSNFYGYKGSFNKWFLLLMSNQVDYGSYFDYHQEWDLAIKNNPDLPVLVVLYEDMKEDLPREIRKMAKFIGCTLNDQQVEDIAKAAGFDTMKEALSGTFTNIFMRKGQVGDWKNWLTVAQSEMVDEAVQEKLKGTRFASPRYTL